MASSHYVGKAGQLAVMAELSWRGYNVSIPEVDVGDDVFALDDRSGTLSRIQVKTATGKKLKTGDRVYRCQFTVSADHVANGAGTHYVLAGRCAGSWRYLVFKRFVLARLIAKGLGTEMAPSSHMITVVFYGRREAYTSTKMHATDLSNHAHRWNLWKRLPGGAKSN